MQRFRNYVLALVWLNTIALVAQAQPKSGRISYEVMQKIDFSQMKIVINGQEVRPGSPDAPPDMPETRSFRQHFAFSGSYGKEEQDRSAGGFMVRQMMMDGGPGRPSGPGGSEGRGNRSFSGRPFERSVYFDLANQKTVEVLSIKKDSVTKVYQTELSLNRATGWQETDKTKKIAGFVCKKATVPYRNLTYTVWYTTELPFTYSPIASLTPNKGVVLQIESENEAYKATKIVEEKIDETTVIPPKEAQVVTPEELSSIRQKAMADMRQKMMNQFQNRN